MKKKLRCITISIALFILIILMPITIADVSYKLEAKPDSLSLSVGNGEFIDKEVVIYNKNNYTITGTLRSLIAAFLNVSLDLQLL